MPASSTMDCGWGGGTQGVRGENIHGLMALEVRIICLLELLQDNATQTWDSFDIIDLTFTNNHWNGINNNFNEVNLLETWALSPYVFIYSLK